MSTLTDPQLLETLHWRYATKQFDPARGIPDAEWRTLEEALMLSPSSYGLQPYKFLVIDDQDLRKRLRKASFGQPQITDAARLVVFAIRKNLDRAWVDHYIARTAEVKHVPEESLKAMTRTIIGDLIEGPRHDWIDHWAARQAYIALGVLLTSAAVLGIDACPMEGFSPVQYDEILGLKEPGLGATVLCALGYRSESDHHASEAKMRFSAPDLVEHR
jgi:nitroreductase